MSLQQPIVCIIEAGNSTIKYGLFEGDSLQDSGTVAPEGLLKLTHLFKPDTEVLLAGTVSKSEVVAIGRSFDGLKLQLFHNLSQMPFNSIYESFDLLGDDRKAHIAYAASRFADEAIAVVDFGTCLTVDFVKDATFLGGVISPGVQMRYKAMSQFTGRLPLIEKPEPVKNFPGLNTTECMNIGVINALNAEINSYIEAANQKFVTQFKIVITGGAASLFESSLKPIIFADSNLVLKGYYYILKHNRQA